MRFDKRVYLLQLETTTIDDAGSPVPTYRKVPILAAESSVRQSEHYQAAQAGMAPEMVLITWEHCFDRHRYKKLEYRSRRYNITRIYTRNDGKVELTVELDGDINGPI